MDLQKPEKEPPKLFPLRIPRSQLRRFNALNPWQGSLTGFFRSALTEYLKLQEGQKTPDQLTKEAVGNIVKRDL